MSRQDRFSWFSAQRQQHRSLAAHTSGYNLALSRRLRIEQLEDRRMLAVFSVSNLSDAGADSLREAVSLADSAPGADEIVFVGAAVAGTIGLTSGEIEITNALTITGPGQAALTIDAQQNSRIFNISATSGDFTIAGLTLTGGQTTAGGAAGQGGAIRSLTTGNFTLDQSIVSGSSTTADDAYGGGISAVGDVTLTASTVSGNSTAGYYAGGGGINSAGGITLTSSIVGGNSTTGFGAYGGGISAEGTVTLTASTVSGNSTTGEEAYGGGIYSYLAVTLIGSTVSRNSTESAFVDGGGISTEGTVTLTDSTVRGNNTTGDNALGGGISAGGDVTLTNSTISGNYTTGAEAVGGGISAGGAVSLTNSTVSGNYTVGEAANGGGISADGNVTITSSTVTDNTTNGTFTTGSGISINNSPDSPTITLSNSIVAGNTAGIFGLSPDIDSGTGSLDAAYSLLGTAVTPVPGGIGNLFDNDPMLGPLVDNGGPTLPSGAAILTHALLFGSPAIDAGDPAAAPGVLGVPLFDQRGNNFGRVQNGQIDMGAFEVRKTFSADFDQDLDIDGADFLAWQRGFGTAAPDATRLDGDADNDGDSDGADLIRWQDQFGQPALGPLQGVPLGIEFMNPNLDATVNSVLIDVDSSWIGQGEYFFDILITGVGSNFHQHGTQLVALDDTTFFGVDGALTSVIANWTTDTIPQQANEVYTVCIQILRFLGDDGTFELLGEEKCRDFGPFI